MKIILTVVFVVAGFACLEGHKSPGEHRDGPQPGGPRQPPPRNQTENGTHPDFRKQHDGPQPGGPRQPPPRNHTENETRPHFREHHGRPQPGGPRQPPPRNHTENGTRPDFRNPEGGKRFPGHGPQGHTGFSRRGGQRYLWNKTVDSNLTVPEEGFIGNGSQIVVVISNSRHLRRINITQGRTFFDFNNETALVVYQLDRPSSPCFVGSTDQTLDTVRNELNARNGSTVEAATTVSLYAGATPLAPEEVNALRESNPSVHNFCGNRPIYRVGDPEANAQPSANSTETATISSLISKVTITFPIQPRFPGPFGNPRRGGPKPSRRH